MERAETASGTDQIVQALRSMPLFAGVTEEELVDIARVVASSTENQVKEALHKVDLFDGLDDDDLRRVHELSETVTLEEGETLFEEGEPGDAFYVILRGSVQLTKRNEKLALLRAGDSFGEMALLNDAPRSATARAGSDSSLLALSRDHFEALLDPESMTYKILKGLSRALWATSVRFTAKQRKSSDPRGVIRELSKLMQQRSLPDGIPQTEGFEVAAGTRSLESGAGRAMWDWFVLGDGRLVLVALHVEGKGLPAAHFLALARTLLREIGQDHSDLGTLLRRANNAMVSSRIKGLSRKVGCGLLALGENRVEWAGTGTVPGAIVRAGGGVEELSGTGGPLGVEEDIDYGAREFSMEDGDYVVVLAEVPDGALNLATDALRGGAGRKAQELLPEVQSRLAEADGRLEATTVLAHSVARGAHPLREQRF